MGQIHQPRSNSRSKAMKMALSVRASEGSFQVVDGLDFEEPKAAAAGLPGGCAGPDARRRPGEIESEPDDSAPFFSEQIDMAIARRGATGASRHDGGDEFGAVSQDLLITYSNIVPVPAPRDGPPQGPFHPAHSAWQHTGA